MRLGIIGTRGVPNAYGGFEQFAEFLSKGIVDEHTEVYVYNSHNHPYQESTWEGVHIIHQYDPEVKMGTFGQFIYDLNCIRDSRKRDFDVLLFLGYTSSSIWFWLYPGKPKLFTNMDGLEWKRTKYSKPVKAFLQFAEFLGAKFGGHLISDSKGIKSYLQEQYGLDSTFIPYGAEVFDDPNEAVLQEYELAPYNYNMLIARLEPENSIEPILEAISQSNSGKKMLVVGGTNNAFGALMREKYESDDILFTGGIYNTNHLNNLRYFSNIYFHGHTVGGTNPSLLEAMGSQAFIIANDNPFNKAILEDEALYFSDAEDLTEILNKDLLKSDYMHWVKKNFRKVQEQYNWPLIISHYKKVLMTK